MARKSTGNLTPRTRKTSSPAVEPVAAPSIPAQAEVEVAAPVAAATAAPKKAASNIDEEIRRRAYEIFLERKGVAGDPNRDWLLAEREVRSRHASERHRAASAGSH